MVQIPTPQFRMEPGGYAVADVDAVLNQFFYALEAAPDSLNSADMRGIRFLRAEGQPGYSPAQVDAWIDRVARELDGRTSGYRPSTTPSPAPYTELDEAFDPPSELASQTSSSVSIPSATPTDPSTDPGRNAVKEIPATPPWVSLTAAVVILTLIIYLVATYLR